ncbi:hypothetical protein [Actinoplanes sp. NPDC051411]
MGADALDAAPAVQLEVEVAFQRVVGRLDELPDGFEQVLFGVRGLVSV